MPGPLGDHVVAVSCDEGPRVVIERDDAEATTAMLDVEE